VQVVMTDAAREFITPVTMQALSAAGLTSQWDAREPNNMAHINLTRDRRCGRGRAGQRRLHRAARAGRAGELLSSVPARADRALRAAAGAGDEPRDVGPPGHAAQPGAGAGRRRRAARAGQRRRRPAARSATAACWRPAELREEIVAALPAEAAGGERVLITAGPTFEAIDPVRGITNRSSGKMGFALARAAREAGAEVTLVAGPVHLTRRAG
jgi:phosphopantothenoylcysteine decarboxylase/phosphopantothenate--cysteine ligase